MPIEHPRLQWTPTFGEPTAAYRWSDDIRARDDAFPRMYARVYQVPLDDDPDEQWLWFVGERESIAYGAAPTSRAASLAAESAWFAYREEVYRVPPPGRADQNGGRRRSYF